MLGVGDGLRLGARMGLRVGMQRIDGDGSLPPKQASPTCPKGRARGWVGPFSISIKEDAVATKATAPSAQPTQLERLGAEFPGGAVKTRSQQGQTLTYISIDGTINRLNEVLGAAWSIASANTTITTATWKTKDGPREGYMAFTELYLTADVDGFQKTAYGVGAMQNVDPDMAVKTALAEALKKAGHQLGIALYLWDADGRTRAEARMKLAKATDSESSLKQAVFKLAEQKSGSKPETAAAVAKIFGRTAGALADKAVLIEILEEEGVL